MPCHYSAKLFNMADHSRSSSQASTSSMYAEAPPPKQGRSETRGPSTRSKSSVQSTAADKDAIRRQGALEKHFTKAQKAFEAGNGSITSVSSRGLTTPSQTVTVAQVHQANTYPSMEEQEMQVVDIDPSAEGTDLASGSSHSHKQPGPSASFTPTAAGLHQEEGHPLTLSKEMCSIIARTISKGIDEALTKRGTVSPLPESDPGQKISHCRRQAGSDYLQRCHSPSPHHTTPLGGRRKRLLILIFPRMKISSRII